jgi:prepilin signal peptidase PulO-like enzyme (type II secretory pathway)
VSALLRGAGRRGALPCGPSLAAGAVVAAFWGPQIADWYQRTILHV